MEINLWYWFIEYGKVLCAYLLLMFLWPSVVFRGHLRTKSKTYRFGFCVTATVIIVNTVILGLGLLHILSQSFVRVVFYGIFVCALLKNVAAYLNRRYRSMMEAKFPDVRTLYGRYRVLVIVILFFMVCYTYVKRAVRFLSFDYLKKLQSCNWPKVRIRIKEKVWHFGCRINQFFWKYGILAMILVFGMMYLSYGAFQVHSYGFGDLYVHHAWIYGLIEGEIFSEGVYPAAMHCFIYTMSTLFGVKVYSILLFLQGIHVGVFLIAVYILLRKVFHWQYTPLFVLTLFLTLDLKNIDMVRGMYRLQITLPQEFGLYTVCLCAVSLLSYLREEEKSQYERSENLFLFMLSLAAAIMIHFHVVIMVFIVCMAFAIFSLEKLFCRKRLLPFAASVLCAIIIAGAPMLWALAQGTLFNASIDWALNIMNNGGESVIYQPIEAESILLKIYENGYIQLYGIRRTFFILLTTGIAVMFCILSRRKASLKFLQEICLEYPPVIVASIFYVIVCAAPWIGLPVLIPEGRFFANGHMMVLAVTAMPVDVIFSRLACLYKNSTMRVMSLLAVAGIYAGVWVSGNFRGFLFYELSRYPAAVTVTEQIIDTFPKGSYTIVSPTDELYPVIQYGWHEELITFVENCNSQKYVIPTEYVFIYVEKKPILYAQDHFFQGPAWLGEEKYLAFDWNKDFQGGSKDNVVSLGPEIISSQISEKEAQKDIPEYTNPWRMYAKLDSRTILESKLYEWCQKFAKQYPAVMNIYYEDEAFVCYYFRQDAKKMPYDLALKP